MGLGQVVVQWQHLMAGIGGDPGRVDLLERLVEAWREPHRAYHTMQHLQECLELLEAWVPAGEQRAHLGMALWFHDVVYDTRAHDSEDRSIELARNQLAGAGVSLQSIGRISRLIEVTKHSAVAPTTDDEHLMVDIDLAIFGASPARWDESCRQVRQEFAWVPLDVYCAKRGAFLDAVLARPRIYGTVHGVAREAQARSNIKREIDRLRAQA